MSSNLTHTRVDGAGMRAQWDEGERQQCHGRGGERGKQGCLRCVQAVFKVHAGSGLISADRDESRAVRH